MEEASAKKIGLAFSGGIDSTAAGIILKNQGYEVLAVTMSVKTPENDAVLERAHCISEKIGIQHEVIDLNNEFEREVISPFIDAYRYGKTPNPCVRCNRKMKFGLLLQAAHRYGCDIFATGHYARTCRSDNKKICLKRGIDSGKDQSYMLWTLGQEILDGVLFPLGGTTKEESRKLVVENGIEDKMAESQDICFLAGQSYRSLFDNQPGYIVNPGPVYKSDGALIGKHKGLPLYTIGQRKGLDLGVHEALYVVEINPQDNSITVGGKEDLKRGCFSICDINFISGEPPAEHFECEVETRYRGPLAFAEIEMINTTRGIVHYREPGLWGAPGQSAVFYTGDLLIGGGVIEPVQCQER
ncbi:MAG: tRNA 2-thiouridine(34) synthase MnmA [Actinobacteria bacterium]|nr:tRNA 2-thiouridine(34) synthase MnmA [Actinomycetota bacterium]